MLGDKLKDINPIEIRPTSMGQELFGLNDIPLTLQHSGGVYLFRDNGIIRAGVTIDHYKKYKDYFLIKDKDY